MAYKWKPNAASKQEYIDFINECEKIKNDYKVSFSDKYESAYFQKDGKNYRISQHQIQFDSYHHSFGGSKVSDYDFNIVVRGKIKMLERLKMELGI